MVLSTPQQLPLLDARVMITAPRQYAQKLGAQLLTAGARPVWLPGVTISELEGAALAQLDAALLPLLSGQPPPFTHLAFTSKNGIYAVVDRLATLCGDFETGVRLLEASGMQLCALGADGEVLRSLGLPLHLSPPEASTQGLVRELAARGEAAGAAVLCPVPLVTGGLTEPAVVPKFLAALTAAGATPTRVPAYLTTTGAEPDTCAAEARMLAGGDIDAVAFSSTAEAQGLLHALGPNGRELLHRAVAEHGVVLAAHGPYTAQGAGEVLGLPITCVSKDFTTFAGLVTALSEALEGRVAQRRGKGAARRQLASVGA